MNCSILFYNRLNFLIRQRIIDLTPEKEIKNQTAFNILLFLYQAKNNEESLKQLEVELQQSQSGINEMSLYLENMGLIVRFKDPVDMRRLKAKLTEKGLEYAKRKEKEYTEHEMILLSGISEEEKKIYLKVATTMYKNGLAYLKDKEGKNEGN